MAIEIQNLPEEMGEETVLGNNDDGTICSKILGSTANRSVILSSVSGGSSSNKCEVKDKSSFAEEAASVNKEAETKMRGEDDLSLAGSNGEKKERSRPGDLKKNEKDDKVTDEQIEDRDFDKNPTVMYALVQKKLWKETIARAKKSPGEARAFICRREKDGRVRWRLLPLHVAIVFKAPEDVVESLLTAFPKAAEEKDDQGMLPLHLAFRNGASESAVNLLLLAYPQSVDIPDRKGRVPLTLAKAATSPNREIYIKALEKGPSHYAVSALACARARITAEQNAIFEAKLLQARESQKCVLSEHEAQAEKMLQQVQEKVDEKELELAKLHETSQVLVDHVTSLEAQINTRSDTERFLATKIAKLEEKLKESEILKNEREKFLATKTSKFEEEIKENERLMDKKETEFQEGKIDFNKQKEHFLAKINVVETSLSSTREKLAHSIYTLGKREEEWATTEKKMDEKCRETEVEWANARANCAIVEAQLKKRMDNEHLLASQVSNLASRLAECSHEMNENKLEYTKGVKELTDERLSLQLTVEDLSKRLHNVTAVIQDTHKHQIVIVDDAIGNEEIMANCMETHAKMVSESIQQERLLRKSRDEMMKMVEQSYDEAEEKRQKLMENVTDQGKHLSCMIKTRGNMLACVQNVTTNITSILQNELADVDKCEKEGENNVEKDDEEKLLVEKLVEKTTVKVEEIAETETDEAVKDIEISRVSEEENGGGEEIKTGSIAKKYDSPVLENEVDVKMENYCSNEERCEYDAPRSIVSDGRITAE